MPDTQAVDYTHNHTFSDYGAGHGISPENLPAVSWDEIDHQVGERAECRLDVDVDASGLRFNERGNLTSDAFDEVEMSDQAFQQLCAFAGEGVSPRYLRQFPPGGEAGWSHQLNYLLEKSDGAMTVRALTSENGGLPVARAFVSAGYGRFDDIDLLPSLKDIIGDGQVYHFSMDQNTTIVHAALGEPFEAKENDFIYHGLRYRNSETGSGALRLLAQVLRTVCANLAADFLGDAFRYSRKHFLGEKQSHASAVAAISKDMEFVGWKIGQAKDQVVEVVDTTIDHNEPYPERRLRAITKDAGFSRRAQEHSVLALSREYGTTGWHVWQALTSAARSMPAPWSYRERCDLEETAGRYVQRLAKKAA